MAKLFLSIGILYLVIRFGLTQQLDALGVYASYVFEIVLVTLAIIFYGFKITSLLKYKMPLNWIAALALVAGFLTFKAASPLGLIVPFDFESSAGILLLLLVAPVLEELIFRFMLWQPTQIVSKNQTIAWIVTSILFSYSHFHAYWFVPAELHSFVVYQTAYTLLLGLACGIAVLRYSSLLGAILIHFAFNLGFYFAALAV